LDVRADEPELLDPIRPVLSGIHRDGDARCWSARRGRDMVDIERLLSSPGVDLDRASLHFRLFERESAASSKSPRASAKPGTALIREVDRTPWRRGSDFRL
jgi:hypothetical protein